VAIEQARAKLTVSLRITGVRSDGYHLIDAEMVTLDLADELFFADGDGLEIAVEGHAAHGLRVVADDENLVSRAMRAVGRRAFVRVQKRIPAGAGLGGGSADAAAVLRWAGRDQAGDLALAASLGADVPFCVIGGRARVCGIGEVLEPLAPVSAVYTLSIPPFGVSTPAVYRAWDSMGGPEGDNANDLEAAALLIEPRLCWWRDQLDAATGIRPTLAGSGSTWFVPGEFPGEGRVVARTAFD
jgi:4-diphosphocytidyl-2-C-methyl-D-erythritol kinase